METDASKLSLTLIAAVKRRKYLYDRTEDQYFNRRFIEREWKAIGEELGVHHAKAKKTWTQLRDYFVRIHNKLFSTGLGVDQKKKWYLYDDMTFLVPYLLSSERKSTLNVSDQYSDNDGSHLSETANIEASFSNEALIIAVKQRKFLYDKTDDQYANKMFIESQWKKIGEELGVDHQAAKKRWTALRDYFVKSHRLMSSKTQEKRKKWYLYDIMKFVLPHISPQMNFSALEYNEDEVSHFSEESYVSEQSYNYSEEYDPDTPVHFSEQFPQDSTSPPSSSSQKRRLECDDEDLSPQSVNFEILKALRSMNTSNLKDDEDEMFLLSLAPKMRVLDPILKIECQAEMQMVLVRYMQRALGSNSTLEQLTHHPDNSDLNIRKEEPNSNSDTSP